MYRYSVNNMSNSGIYIATENCRDFTTIKFCVWNVIESTVNSVDFRNYLLHSVNK